MNNIIKLNPNGIFDVLIIFLSFIISHLDIEMTRINTII